MEDPQLGGLNSRNVLSLSSRDAIAGQGVGRAAFPLKPREKECCLAHGATRAPWLERHIIPVLCVFTLSYLDVCPSLCSNFPDL